MKNKSKEIMDIVFNLANGKKIIDELNTYQFNMTISTKKNVEELEIINKLVDFAEDNGYWLGGGLTLLNEDDEITHEDDVINTQQELINVLESQVMDLSMMSKIELGDDVIDKIKQLKGLLNDYPYNPNDFLNFDKIEKLKEQYNFELIDNVSHGIDGKTYLVETYETSLIWFLEKHKDKKIYIYSKSLPTVRAIVI